MQGMRFLLINEAGQIINNGVITQRVTEERYMCTFMRPPQVSRLCHVDEIAGWNLFPNDEMLQAFVTELQQQANADEPPGGAIPPDMPPGAPGAIQRDQRAEGGPGLVNPEGHVQPGGVTSKKTSKKKAKKKAKKKVAKKKRNGSTKR